MEFQATVSSPWRGLVVVVHLEAVLVGLKRRLESSAATWPSQKNFEDDGRWGCLWSGVNAAILRALNLPEFDIELILSGKTAKLLRMKPAERASAEPVHFLAAWRVELAEDGYGGKWFLITNAATMYSILIPRVRGM